MQDKAELCKDAVAAGGESQEVSCADLRVHEIDKLDAMIGLPSS